MAEQWFREPQSHRHMLRHLGLLAGATLALDALISRKIRIITHRCQSYENRAPGKLKA